MNISNPSHTTGKRGKLHSFVHRAADSCTPRMQGAHHLVALLGRRRSLYLVFLSVVFGVKFLPSFASDFTHPA